MATGGGPAGRGGERFEASGLVSYGYHKQVLLFAEITPPDTLPAAQELVFKARTGWLACKESCIPGEAELELKLAVGDARPSPGQRLFDQFSSRIPKPIETEDAIGSLFSARPEQVLDADRYFIAQTHIAIGVRALFYNAPSIAS